MDRPLVAVVLAGGTGTRLYPASRPDRPKQLHSFGGDRSLLERTVDRTGFADETFVLTRPDLEEAIRSQVPEAAVLTEPEPKDTGPALVYATHRVREQVGDCVLCVLPSDHHVDGDLAGTLRRGARVAADTGGLVTVGVEPDRPATGYGYIDPGAAREGNARTPDEEGSSGEVFAVDAFVEKPDAETAARYVEAGYLWNAGLFCWTPSAFLDAAREGELAPLVAACESGAVAEGFAAVAAISVDYAVLEGADDVFVVPAAFEWDDLGTWDSVGRVGTDDGSGNVVLGEGLAIDASDCVLATDGHVSAVGVSDLVVASYGGRTLVVPRSEAERVREVVDTLGGATADEGEM